MSIKYDEYFKFTERLIFHKIRMWAHRDSNPEPTDYESAALTVELWAQNVKKLSERGKGFQPLNCM